MGQQADQNNFGVRRKLGLLALAAATCLGGTVFTVAPASAAPVVAKSNKAVVRNDGLAPVAVTALTDLQTYMRSGDQSALQVYTATRDAIATEIASRLAVDPARMIAAWQNADFPHQAALMAAFTQLGVPYRRNTSKEGTGFDCSGLTTYAWGVAGVTLTRQSGAQIRAASSRTAETAMAGDLMYYPGHIMLYLGVDRTMVHSPYSGRTVEVDNLPGRRIPRFGNPIG